MQAAAGQQPRQGRSRGAQERGDGEDGEPNQEQPPPAEVIASPSTEQDERPERQEIGVDRPGQLGGAGAEIARERRKRDVDHRAVDEGDARAEDRGGEGRARVRVAAWESGRRDPGVAGPGDRAAHAATACTPDERALLLPAHPLADPVGIDAQLTQDEDREIEPRRHAAIDDRQHARST